MKTPKDFRMVELQPSDSSKAGVKFKIGDTEVLINNRGIRCFSKRAILRIGMLLRDSEVAKEVRTQLLAT